MSTLWVAEQPRVIASNGNTLNGVMRADLIRKVFICSATVAQKTPSPPSSIHGRGGPTLRAPAQHGSNNTHNGAPPVFVRGGWDGANYRAIFKSEGAYPIAATPALTTVTFCRSNCFHKTFFILSITRSLTQSCFIVCIVPMLIVLVGLQSNQ